MPLLDKSRFDEMKVAAAAAAVAANFRGKNLNPFLETKGFFLSPTKTPIYKIREYF